MVNGAPDKHNPDYRPLCRPEKAMDAAETEDLLRRARVGRLGTVGPDGRPYVVPVNFVYQDGRIYIHSALSGHKIDNLTANPNACFEVDEDLGIKPARRACNVGQHYRSAIAFGTARLLGEGSRRHEILRTLACRYVGPDVIMPEDADLERVAIIEITVDRLTGKKDVLK